MTDKERPMQLSIGEKIGEGRYRQCFAVPGTDLCVKIPFKQRQKKYFGINVTFSMWFYTLLKFRTTNFNQKEFQIFTSLPEPLQPYLPNCIVENDGLLFLQRPKNWDGSYSQDMRQIGPVHNAAFWRHVDNIVDILKKHQLYLMDTFHLGNNVLVQKISAEEWRPVLIDVKRLGWYTYPFQPHLLLKSQQRKKFERRHKIFLSGFKP